MKTVHVTYRQPYDGADISPRSMSDYVQDHVTVDTPDAVRRVFNLPSAEIQEIVVRNGGGTEPHIGNWRKVWPA